MLITEHTKQVVHLQPADVGKLGAGCYYLDALVLLNGDQVELGDEVGFNIGCYVNGYGGLHIGSRTRFGPYCMIHTANHAMDDPHRSIWEQGWVKQPVRIGAECWVGMNAAILPGVTIGDRVVIGAGSVVTRDVPDNVVAAGNPCRVIREHGGRR